MTMFYYKAVTPDGEPVEGVINAQNLESAIETVRSQGHILLRATEGGSEIRPGAGQKKPRLTGYQLVEFTRQLAIMLGAGLDLDRALSVLVDTAESDRTKALLERIQNRIHDGGSLSEALAAEGGGFSRLYVNMVRAGETAGALELVLKRLSGYLERSLMLRETIKSALIYPIILATVSAVSVIILVVFVIPRFATLFETAGAALPWSTKIIMELGVMAREDWWIAALSLGGFIIVARRLLYLPVARRWVDGALLAVPVVGGLILKIEVARFSRTLGTLLQNGVPILAALAGVKETLGNQAIISAMENVEESLKQGRGLAVPLAEAGVFPKQAIYLIKVGEESGKLEEMLERIADIYDREVQTSVSRLLALLEPAVILGLGGVVAAIVFSLLAAIMGLNNLPM